MRRITTFSLLAFFVFIATAANVQAQGWKIFKPIVGPAKAAVDYAHRSKPDVPPDGVVENLANNIDWLEHHVDCFGTIVAKHPDVWGESRLMRHRQEYERQMAAQLDKFEVRMNASLARSDQAFLGMAFSLSQAVNGGTAENAQDAADLTAAMISNPSQTVVTTDGKTVTTTPAAVGRTAPFGMNDATSNKFSFENGKELSLEPTIQLDQMSRYLQHLHELRRINEGDDNADSPGYSLNLVRIPVSVLPGRQTRTGYGAEITVTATPYVTPELLPMTFRTLVVNDLVDQLAYPITRVINSQDKFITTELKKLAQIHFDKSTSQALAATNSRKGDRSIVTVALQEDARFEELPPLPPAEPGQIPPNRPPQPSLIDELLAIPAEQRAQHFKAAQQWLATGAGQRAKAAVGAGMAAPAAAPKLATTVMMFQGTASEEINATLIPATNNRRMQRPMPPSHVVRTFDLYLLAHVAADVYAGLLDHPSNKDVDGNAALHLMDVRSILQEEAAAAYDFLSQPKNVAIWEHCIPGLAEAVRTQDTKEIDVRKQKFLRFVDVDLALTDGSTTIALAWALLVESALLDQRLNQDMREAAVSKGCQCMSVDQLPFYGPDPPAEARQAFIEYVNCRWPVQVFALDPVIQEQNVADMYARRRELQVAASLAFASGEMSAGALTRFNRRLEWDMATIDLNRTVVGFSHGHDTFGWRFQPRFQTPPIQGNLAAFKQSLFGGPTEDQDLRKRELESGMRECVAIVVMPSFVPYCTFDTRANWFKLTDPKSTVMSNHDALKLSRGITAMRNARLECVRFAHHYRPGEIERLLKRVDQLDRELPLQTMQVQIPYENTAGGFELFNHGITDLAPELVGFYGEPGINRNGHTTLYLVGDGFSVHDTRVIAGGRKVGFQLLSRQVMEVEIPPGVQILKDRRDDEVVDVHVATPYGISSHLLVPLSKDGSLPDSEPLVYELLDSPVVQYTYTVPTPAANSAPTAAIDAAATVNPRTIRVQVPRGSTPLGDAKLIFYVSHQGKFLGFTEVNIKLDAATNQYFLPAADMVTLLGDSGIAKSVKAQLNTMLPAVSSRPNPSFDVQLEAVLNNTVVPVRQTMTVTTVGRN